MNLQSNLEGSRWNQIRESQARKLTMTGPRNQSFPESDLPNEFKRKLKLPVCCRRAADRVEIAQSGYVNCPHREPTGGVVLSIIIYKGVRHREKRMVQHIKCFEPELQVQALCKSCSLHGAEIQADISRATQNTARPASEDLEVGRQGKRGDIPPVEKCLGPAVGIANQIAVVLLKTDIVHCRIAPRQAGRGKASPDESDTTYLPATKELVCRA